LHLTRPKFPSVQVLIGVEPLKQTHSSQNRVRGAGFACVGDLLRDDQALVGFVMGSVVSVKWRVDFRGLNRVISVLGQKDRNFTLVFFSDRLNEVVDFIGKLKRLDADDKALCLYTAVIEEVIASRLLSPPQH
jgi:hypothetical protein